MLKRFLLLLSIFFGFIATACQPVTSQAAPERAAYTPSPTQTRPAQKAVPEKAYKVWDYVKKNGRAMPNYVGGRTFQNREGLLPKKMPNGRPIAYQEWDVNPKVPGVNRGAERLCTGSDGRAYYTSDHYRFFTELK